MVHAQDYSYFPTAIAIVNIPLIALTIYATATTSGGHLNPTISLATWLAGMLPLSLTFSLPSVLLHPLHSSCPVSCPLFRRCGCATFIMIRRLILFSTSYISPVLLVCSVHECSSTFTYFPSSLLLLFSSLQASPNSHVSLFMCVYKSLHRSPLPTLPSTCCQNLFLKQV